MPPKKRTKSSITKGAPRRSARNAGPSAPRLPDVYREMLAEVAAVAAHDDVNPPRKRQRLGQVNATDQATLEVPDHVFREIPDPTEVQRHPQTIFTDFLSTDDEDEFEDVDLEVPEVEDKPEQKILTIDLSEPLTTPNRSVKRPILSMAERALRLEWHKAHFFLLLLSLWCRNRWCESSQVQAILKKLVPRSVVKLLHEDDSKPALQRSYSFNKAIGEICLLWRTTWTVVGKGMRRANWRTGIDLNKESETHEELDLDDFQTAAKTLRGSRDLGAQLFCALLRSVAVETRLVCSLQVLPFSAAAKGVTPEKPQQHYNLAGTQDFGSAASITPRKRQKDSPYPIFWVEILPPVTQTWTPIDAVVRHTINKPKTGFEPPASDTLNSMAYVLAFEDDGSARDVTRRYTQWYNAKTRKVRVESTRGGEAWLRSTLSKFTKPFPELRDELEDADLLRRSETEGMPKSIQDFKGHPIYVLERHLRKTEVIYPKREVGMTTTGVGQKDQTLESVYRRQDVHLCRSSDAWYRRGRDIKQGETPLKRVAKRTRASPDLDEDGQPTDDEAVLYAEFQTEVYEPPPVVDGRIPRNHFGNLDVYVPSMIPAGAIHVQHPLAGKAAKLIGVDFADAVTGFEFKGRQGTAVVNGIVVASCTRFGLDAVIFGMQHQMIEEAEYERSTLLLSLWKRWLTALRIRERVQRDFGGRSDEDEDSEDRTFRDSDEEIAGGFMPDGQTPNVVAPPQRVSATGKDALSKLLLKGLPPVPTRQEVVVVESPHQLSKLGRQIIPSTESPPSIQVRGPNDSMMFSGPTLDAQEGGGFFMENENVEGSPPIQRDDDFQGGGFMVDDEPVLYHSAQHEPPVNKDVATNVTTKPSEPVQPGSGSSSSQTVLPTHAIEENAFTQGKDHSETGPDLHQSSHELPTVDTSFNTRASPVEELKSEASVLSHDPEEDDAEPEWLMESLGD